MNQTGPEVRKKKLPGCRSKSTVMGWFWSWISIFSCSKSCGERRRWFWTGPDCWNLQMGLVTSEPAVRLKVLLEQNQNQFEVRSRTLESKTLWLIALNRSEPIRTIQNRSEPEPAGGSGSLTRTGSSPPPHSAGCTWGSSGRRRRSGCSTDPEPDQGVLQPGQNWVSLMSPINRTWLFGFSLLDQNQQKVTSAGTSGLWIQIIRVWRHSL